MSRDKLSFILYEIMVLLIIMLICIGVLNRKKELVYNNGFSDGYEYALEKYGITE